MAWGAETILGLEQPASQHKPKPATNHFNMEKVVKGRLNPFLAVDLSLIAGCWLFMLKMGIWA
jgi:hypothetical protein